MTKFWYTCHYHIHFVETRLTVIQVAQKPPPSISLDASASYLLAGGLGGLGRSIARWLVNHGAKNLIFISRSGAASPEARALIDSLDSSNIRTCILRCDISDSLEVSDLLSTTLQTFPPIKGVIQGTMTLNDSLFTNMTAEQWTSTILPKVYGSKNLHDMTISQPLDFFILLSSLHSFIGNPGQANYAAGCAYQVALAKYRNKCGLAATAIDLGIVGDVGYVVEHKDQGERRVKVQDFTHINEEEMLALIELGIREPMLGHLVTGLDSTLDISASADELPFFARDPVLSHLDYLRPHRTRQNIEQDASDTAAVGGGPSISLAAQLASSSSPESTKNVVLVALMKKLSRSLMMDVAELDAKRSLAAYGTDSLVAAELKNWVVRETRVVVSVFDILQSSSIEALVDRIMDKLAAKE